MTSPSPSFAFIAVPYEKTTSFMKGAALGPEALLADWSRLQRAEGAPPPGMVRWVEQGKLRAASSMLDETAKGVAQAVGSGCLPVTLGGEHTVTLGAVRGLAGHDKELGVVQLDAHADLRGRYDGSRYSHACVMRRLDEDMGLPVLPVGVRALSRAEALILKKRSLPWLPGSLLGKWKDLLPPLLKGFPEKIYLTVDMDFFDPSVVPGVGTPEPGGAGWYQALEIIDALLEGRRLAGCDVVELCPPREERVSVRAAARLVLHLLGRAVPD